MPGLQDRIDQGLAWLADPVNARRGRGALLAVGRPAVGTLVETLSATPTEAAGPVTDRVIELLGELGARDASPVVARFVHSSRPKTEEAALWTLGALRSPTHFKRIKEWYTRSHAPIRNKAFDALARSGHPDALPTVLLELVEGSEARRRSAEANLHRFGPAARKAVLPLLDSEDRRERAAALRALAYMDTHDAMERLLSGLIDSDSTIVSAAVIGLAGRGGAEAREAVSRYWDSRKVDVRAAVAHALGAFANPEDLETLELMTNDASMSVRVAAARSLAHHGPLARPMLTRLARLGPDGATARAAAEALMKKADATADLVPLLGSRHREVRNLAADALEERPGGETALVQALASEDDAARTGASETIIARGTPMVPAVLEVARRAPDAALPDILYVLGEIGSPAAVPFAARLATEGTDLTIRKAAIDTLSRCGEGERIEPTLLAALDDPAVEVRQAAVKALGEKRVHGAADRLMALIESEVRPVQRAAIGAIGSLRHQAAVDALIAQYTESRTAGQDPAIREDIVVALGRIGGRATLPALIHAMSDRDMRVRRAAEQALE
jgi:HEAT repeat protein